MGGQKYLHFYCWYCIKKLKEGKNPQKVSEFLKYSNENKIYVNWDLFHLIHGIRQVNMDISRYEINEKPSNNVKK